MSIHLRIDWQTRWTAEGQNLSLLLASCGAQCKWNNNMPSLEDFGVEGM